MPSDPDRNPERGLLAALAAEDPAERSRAAREIARRGSTAAFATQALLGLLDDGDPVVRAMAAAALGKIEAASAGVVRALAARLDDPVFPVRFWALDALARLGSRAQDALGDIEAVARQGEAVPPVVRAAALRAAAAIRAAPGGDPLPRSSASDPRG